jgi:hypothetical protein
MIKLEFKLVVCNAPDAMDAPQVQINSLHVGFDNLHVTKNSPERIDDVARIKISGCDLMQHRRKENEILATDQRHLYVRTAGQPFVEVHCRVKPGEPTTGNDYSSRFHAITPNGNATRQIEMLLMDAIIHSFSHLFLKLFSV